MTCEKMEKIYFTKVKEVKLAPDIKLYEFLDNYF